MSVSYSCTFDALFNVYFIVLYTLNSVDNDTYINHTKRQ